jgi:hypothetical protein
MTLSLQKQAPPLNTVQPPNMAWRWVVGELAAVRTPAVRCWWVVTGSSLIQATSVKACNPALQHALLHAQPFSKKASTISLNKCFLYRVKK